MNQEYWVCIIGPVDRDRLLPGADLRPRMSAEDAVRQEVAGFNPNDQLKVFSGWGLREKDLGLVLDAWHATSSIRSLSQPSLENLKRRVEERLAKSTGAGPAVPRPTEERPD